MTKRQRSAFSSPTTLNCISDPLMFSLHNKSLIHIELYIVNDSELYYIYFKAFVVAICQNSFNKWKTQETDNNGGNQANRLFFIGRKCIFGHFNQLRQSSEKVLNLWGQITGGALS